MSRENSGIFSYFFGNPPFEVTKYEILEKYTSFSYGRYGICAVRASLERVEPHQYVLGGRDMLFAVRWIGECKTPTPAPFSGAGRSRGDYDGGIAVRSYFQPGLWRLGLPDNAREFPRTDLSAFFHSVDALELGRDGALQILRRIFQPTGAQAALSCRAIARIRTGSTFTTSRS